jgi:hypothetical protein
MKKRDAATLLLRLMVIYAMFQFAPSLLYVIGLLGTITSSPHPEHAALILGITFLTPLIWIGLCLLVLRFSTRIASKLMPDDGDLGSLLTLSFQECQVLGFNFIGILLIVQSFPEIIQLISTIRFEGGVSDTVGRAVIYRRILPKVLAFVTEFGIGLLLFFRARGLASLWAMLQKKARPMKTEPESNHVEHSAEK